MWMHVLTDMGMRVRVHRSVGVSVQVRVRDAPARPPQGPRGIAQPETDQHRRRQLATCRLEPEH